MMYKYKNNSGWTVSLFDECGAKFVLRDKQTLNLNVKLINVPSYVRCTIVKDEQTRRTSRRQVIEPEDKQTKEDDIK